MERTRNEEMVRDDWKTKALNPPVLRFRMPSASEVTANESALDPNQWFAQRFPEQTVTFGPAFLECRYEDGDGLNRFIPAEINTDFFASVLGGDRRLNHQVVWVEPEATFYFYDWREDAFCPTTAQKLELLLSNYLIRCSQEMGALVDIRPLMTSFRKGELLKSVVERSKALLLADVTFFQGAGGHRRLVDGRIVEPTAKPSYEMFVESVLTKEPTSVVTVADAFSKYFTFCREHQMMPLTRHEFRSLVAEVVREQLGLGIRKDIPGQNGKQQEGWRGMRLRQDDHAALGLS